MAPVSEKVLALGDTASVMPSLAKKIGNLYVAYPKRLDSVVLQRNEKSFPFHGLDYPLSISCYEFITTMSKTFSLFHAELGYAVACDAAKVPYGVHIHGVTDIGLLFPKSAPGRLLKRSYRRALMNARYVVCHPAVVASVKSIRKDAVSLPLPIDTDQFNDKVAAHSFGSDIAVFSPSRMDRWKGHEIIWEALRRMRNRERVTVFQSDWGWEPEYTRFRKNAPENVRFIPTVPRERIASYYRGAIIVVGQMKIGDFGMTELEAAACRAPVLVYLRDETTPFLPKSNDPQSLAETMDRLIEEEETRTRYAQSCIDQILPTVSLEVVSKRFLAVLESADRGRNLGSGGPASLFLGTCFELVGRLLGARAFGRLKAFLIGL